MKFKAILIGLVALLVLIISLQNAEVVAVQLLFWKVELSRVLLILIMFGLGFASGFIAGTLGGLKHKA